MTLSGDSSNKTVLSARCPVETCRASSLPHGTHGFLQPICPPHPPPVEIKLSQKSSDIENYILVLTFGAKAVFVQVLPAKAAGMNESYVHVCVPFASRGSGHVVVH